MTRKVDVWNAIVARLKASATISGFIDDRHFFEGYRDQILDGDVPCIILFPKTTETLEEETGGRKREIITIGARLLIGVKDRADYVVGTDRHKGLLDFEEDFKNAVEGADRTIGGLVTEIDIKVTDYKNHADQIAEVALDIVLHGNYFTAGAR